MSVLSSVRFSKPGDAGQGQLDEQPAVGAAAHPAAGFGEDLQGGDDRVERPAVDDRLEPRLLAGVAASNAPSAPAASTIRSRRNSSSPLSRSAGWTPSSAAWSTSRERRGRVVIGQGVDQVEQPFVAGGAEQPVNPLDGQLAAAEERSCSRSDCASRIEPLARRATVRRASGSASTPSRRQISTSVSTICSGVIPAKS